MNSFTCPICCEDKLLSSVCVLSKCSHKKTSCKECVVKWIEKEEASGKATPPTCPLCRLEMSEQETVSILGRPFQPQTAAPAVDETEMDDLTRHWLEDQTKPCPSCGARIQKSDGGCDLMECLCGFRFCYRCGSQGAQCYCTPSNHYFWDNILDRQAHRIAPAAAVVEEETGHVDLRRYIQGRIERDRRRTKHENEVKLVDAVISDVWWLFLPEKARERVLEQSERAQKVKFERMIKNLFSGCGTGDCRNCGGANDAVVSDIRYLFMNEKEKAQERTSIEKHERGQRRRKNKARAQAHRDREVDAAPEDVRYLFLNQVEKARHYAAKQKEQSVRMKRAFKRRTLARVRRDDDAFLQDLHLLFED